MAKAFFQTRLHQNNEKPYVALETSRKFQNVKWDVLPQLYKHIIQMYIHVSIIYFFTFNYEEQINTKLDFFQKPIMNLLVEFWQKILIIIIIIL